ncbi:hypothetical protein J2S43_005489 [Catenuloplanes nepalensis]|uniref:Uncharacterized protein n=1 Tax=Catenuloplanes nepalensis TaxID=587533 RepID=A0ABT9MZV5_9ACTN|nr:hypothetical protein [Catenuloplanes nepalensis]MDP9796977.1 hypothetical protein [Catenuloplanes nepalensis]
MQPESVVEGVHGLWAERSEPPDEPCGADGSHLFGLRLRRLREASFTRLQQDLKRVDAVGVRGDRHDCDDSVS